MIEINLLPWREQLKVSQQNRKIAEVLVAFLFASLLLASCHFILLGQLKRVSARLAQLEGGLIKVNQGLEEVRQLYQQFDYQSLPDLDLNIILNRQKQILTFLRKLTELMPAAVHLRQLDFEEKTWSIEGVAPAQTDILLFSERLQKNLNGEDLSGALKKEKYLNIKKKNAFFYYQLRFEVGL